MAISIDSLKLDSLEVKEELVDEDYINHQVSVLMSDEELTPGSSAAGGVNEECEEEDDKLQGWINGPSNNYNAKRHTKYALSLFEIFSKRENVNFEDIDNKALDVLLSNFYKAARNKKGDLYALKSMQSIRFGLQRYFLESRGIDIIRSDEFSLSHKTFGAVSRKLKRFGKDKVRHHPQITVDDMARMQASLDLSIPQGLQHKVFLDTVLYFGRSGMRNLRTTRPGDFVLHQENNQLFYTFRENREAQMCAMPGNPRCPVANLKRYISKLNSNCEWMWQRPRQRFSDSEDPCIWYENSPLGKDNLSFMTRTISELAGCNKGYTIQSLRKSMTEKMLESLSRNDSTSQNRDYAITVIALPRSTSNSVVTRINKMITASPRVPVAAPITDSSMNIIENPSSVTASSSDKATNLQTMQQNTSVTSKSNTGVNEGTMTELTWIELPRKLVQSKDASTQWEKQPPTHSTHSTSTQDLYKPECGDDGELKQDGLGWCSEDEFMDSSEPSDVHIDGSSIVAWSRGDVEETTVAQSQEREQSNTPILRRIKEEMIEELEEGDYQTLYVKEEYLEDECQDDDYAHVHLTSGGHPRLEAESPRSTQQTNSYRAPRQNGGPWIGSKKMYGLKFHVTQGNTKVECAINSPSETVKGENLKEAICHKLQVSLDAHSLQYFDKSWQDWVDIAPLMALRGGLQLRVIQTSLRAELSHQIPTTNSQNNHRLKYLVALENNKQVLTVDSPESTASGAAVKEAVRSMLHDLADGLLLQYFDKDWQDWIDVELSMMLGGRMRLNFIQTNLRAELSDQTSTSNSQNKHRLKYLVVLGNNKQVLTIDSPKSTVSGAAVKEAVCGMLRDLADGLLLQYFDEGWRDWIDVETSMMLGGRMRLNVLQASHKSLSDLRC